MSSPAEKELKGGHPPAVKAGGMRITRSRTSSGGEPKLSASPQDEEIVDGPSKGERHTQQVVIAGTVMKGDKEFPAAAVKQYHDKPEPTKEYRSKPHVAQSHHINQPK